MYNSALGKRAAFYDHEKITAPLSPCPPTLKPELQPPTRPEPLAQRPLLIAGLLLVLLYSAGCQRILSTALPFTYRIDIQQGTVLEQQMLDRLEPGMGKTEVRQILGTPSLVDPFHADRWYYIYTLEEDGGERMQRNVVLHFKGGALAMIEGDVIARSSPPPEGGEAIDLAVRVPEKKKKGLFGRLFGGTARDPPRDPGAPTPPADIRPEEPEGTE